jgi:hypothetical protein
VPGTIVGRCHPSIKYHLLRIVWAHTNGGLGVRDGLVRLPVE